MPGASLGQNNDHSAFASTRFMLSIKLPFKPKPRVRKGCNLQKIGDPKSIEQISCANFFFSVILSEIEKLEDVSMPRLEVDGECSWTLVASLIDITGSGIICTEHGYNTV